MVERRLVIPARYAAVAGACAFCASAAVEAGLSEHAAFHVQMAVDEACTNIIEHAYGGEDHGDIDLRCGIHDDKLVVTIRDTGRPFNPSDVPAPRLGSLVEDLEVGGLGLYFMRQVMDEVHFRFSERGNELVMVKRGESGERGEHAGQ
jgi:serine/threonine-protein kinase RsbW